MKSDYSNPNKGRRKFIQQTTLASGVLLFASPLQLFSNDKIQ